MVKALSLLGVLALSHAVEMEMEADKETKGNPNYSPAIDVGDIPQDKCGMTVMANEDGRLEVFAIGPDDGIYHKWQKEAGAQEWTQWMELGGNFHAGPAVAKDPAGRLQIFSRFKDKGYWYKSQMKAGSSSGMTEWKPLGGKFRSGPIASRDSEGFLHIFGRGMDNNLHHRGQLPSPSGGKGNSSIVWTEWVNLGGLLTGYPSILLDHEGLMHILARGQDRALWHLSQLPVQYEKSVVHWGQWEALGGVLASSPKAPSVSDSVWLMQTVVRAADKAFWIKGQQATHQAGVSWGEWKSLKGILTSGPSVITNEEGTLDVFGRGPDRHVWMKHQYLTKAGLQWTPWQDLGGISTTTPATALTEDGMIQLFIRGPERAIWTRKQEENKNGTLVWGSWTSLGGNAKSYAC